MEPRLSIIVVVKDNLFGFELTYKSLRDRNYLNSDDVEIVVVDSSQIPISKDNFSVQYYFTEPKGVFSAMNYGRDKARGTYLYFLNSSDEIVCDCEELVKEIDLEGDLFYFNIIANERVEYPLPLGFLKLGEIPFSHQGVIVKSELSTFSNGLKNVADMELFLRLHKMRVKFTYINKTIVRIAPMSFASNYRFRQFLETYKVLVVHGLWLNILLRFLLSRCVKSLFKPNFSE